MQEYLYPFKEETFSKLQKDTIKRYILAWGGGWLSGFGSSQRYYSPHENQIVTFFFLNSKCYRQTITFKLVVILTSSIHRKTLGNNVFSQEITSYLEPGHYFKL